MAQGKNLVLPMFGSGEYSDREYYENVEPPYFEEISFNAREVQGVIGGLYTLAGFEEAEDLFRSGSVTPVWHKVADEDEESWQASYLIVKSENSEQNQIWLVTFNKKDSPENITIEKINKGGLFYKHLYLTPDGEITPEGEYTYRVHIFPEIKGYSYILDESLKSKDESFPQSAERQFWDRYLTELYGNARINLNEWGIPIESLFFNPSHHSALYVCRFVGLLEFYRDCFFHEVEGDVSEDVRATFFTNLYGEMSHNNESNTLTGEKPEIIDIKSVLRSGSKEDFERVLSGFWSVIRMLNVESDRLEHSGLLFEDIRDYIKSLFGSLGNSTSVESWAENTQGELIPLEVATRCFKSTILQLTQRYSELNRSDHLINELATYVQETFDGFPKFVNEQLTTIYSLAVNV